MLDKTDDSMENNFTVNQIIQGDALEVLKSFQDNTIDTVLTDPPYGLSNHPDKVIRKVLSEWLNGNDSYIPDTKGFMGKSWDAFVPPPALWREVYRVMKPGGTILCFAGSRTQDLMTMSLRLAGFEIKDTILWLYGQGFPKSYNIAKGIESKIKQGSANWTDWKKLDGEEYEQKTGYVKLQAEQGYRDDYSKQISRDIEITVPEAKQWEGYGTALKPSYETIILAIKPNEGSYAENALKWGVAGLNIDEGRISYNGEKPNVGGRGKHTRGEGYGYKPLGENIQANKKGRFPANTLLECICDEVIDGKHTNTECPCYMLDEQSGKIPSSFRRGNRDSRKAIFDFGKQDKTNQGYMDTGGASRFFFCAKASRSERNMGGVANQHTTVKPLTLLEYLVKLTSMPNRDQIYLDPFLGSGTTAMACKKLGKKWIGIELMEEYVEMAKKRISAIPDSLFNRI
jgi:site-specific DNA-methyltransferase (adenine-specific)